jgi:outer membrane protein assembly factor BamB
MRSVIVSSLALITLVSPLLIRPALSVDVIWQTPSYGDHIRCVSAIADQEGFIPARQDVLIEIDATGDPEGHLKLLRGEDGSVIWGTSPPGGVSGGCGYGDMCLTNAPDLSGDGFEEALLGTSWGGRTAYALLADDGGRILWDFDTYFDADESGWVYSIDWIEDVTGDDVAEVIFGCGSDNNTAYCVDGASGAVLWHYPCPDAVYQVAPIRDVNGNGTMDVLVATGDTYADYTYCFEGNSSGIPSYLWRFYVGATSFTVTGGDDVNDDGAADAIIGTWDSGGTVYCVSGADGSLIWSHPVGAYEYVMRVVTIKDLNDNGTADVLVASWDNAIICLDGATGSELWNVPTGSTNGGDVWTIWPIADVDYDGYADVVAGSFDLNAYCVSGRTGTIIWTHNVGNRVYTVRSIEDMNFDGHSEALVGTQYYGGSGGRVFCLDGDGFQTGVPPIADLACRMDGDAVSVSWDFDAALDIRGFNVLRADLDGVESPEELHRRLTERGEFTVARALMERAGLGERGRDDDFVQLNTELLESGSYRDATVVDGVRYAYMITAVHEDGTEELAGPVEILVNLGARGMTLSPPSPNPFRGSASFALSVPRGEPAALEIFTVGGQLVRRLDVSDEHSAVWDGRSDDGERVATGVYLVKLQAGAHSTYGKAVLLR